MSRTSKNSKPAGTDASEAQAANNSVDKVSPPETSDTLSKQLGGGENEFNGTLSSNNDDDLVKSNSGAGNAPIQTDEFNGMELDDVQVDAENQIQAKDKNGDAVGGPSGVENPEAAKHEQPKEKEEVPDPDEQPNSAKQDGVSEDSAVSKESTPTIEEAEDSHEVNKLAVNAPKIVARDDSPEKQQTTPIGTPTRYGNQGT